MTTLKTVAIAITMTLGLLGGGTFAARADGDPPPAPFLRIETGQHTAAINRVSVDAAGRLVATVADDKTVRLWNAQEGRQVSVLRVPIGTGDEGALYAVALSPDGRAVIAAGKTGAWNPTPVLYLLDVEQQRLKGRLPLPAPAFHLAYSPDGRFFAVAFDGRIGIKVYDATNGKLVAEDRDYGDRVTWAAFDRSGRLATASFDGKIRVYDAGFRLIAQKPAPAGKRPFSVAFSPDGALLAVGYLDQPKVSLHVADTLQARPAPATGDLRTGNLAVVAWLGEGPQAQLAAGGAATGRDGRMILRLWGDRGAGQPRDLSIARDSVTDLQPVAGGGLVIGAADPAWGRIDTAGRALYWHGSPIGDFRDVADGRFAVSADGLTVEFGMAKGGTRPFRYSFGDRNLQANPSADPQLVRPTARGRAITLTDWRNLPEPKLGGQRLALSQAELARSAAVTPDGERVLLGTDFFLRLFDARGYELRRVEVPAPAWGVMVSGNGRIAVAALGDGTLRWYSLNPGEDMIERAALYPHPDGRRWVAWTPQAFFDHADLGGKELVGFHLNQNRSTLAQWVDFSQVYRLYYAPELVSNAVLGVDAAGMRSRLAAIGDVRVRLESRPLPRIDLVSYCVDGSGGADCRPIDVTQARRGLSRVGAATPTPGPSPTPGPAPGPVPNNGAGGSARDAESATPGANEATASFRGAVPAGTGQVRLLFRIADQGGGVGPIDIFLNDRNVGRGTTRGLSRVNPAAATPDSVAPRAQAAAPPPPAAAGAAPAKPGLVTEPSGDTFERTVRLDPGANRIVLRAYEGTGVVFQRSANIELTPAAPTVIAQAPPPVTAGPAEARGGPQAVQAAPAPAMDAGPPDLHVLAVGIDRYTGAGINPLQFPVADARAFAQAVRQHANGLYRQVRITELYDDQATLAGVTAALTALGRATRNTDTVLIYLAGHGYADEQVPYHFITQNVSTVSLEALRTQALTQEQLVQLLTEIPARNTFLFLDTCHAGAVPNLNAVNKSAGNIGHEIGRYILAASASDQEARDSYDNRNGLLAYALVHGLSGEAPRVDGRIDSIGLGQFARDRVNALNDELNQRQGQEHRQRALFKVYAEDLRAFPLAVAR